MLGLIYSVMAATGKLLFDGNKAKTVQHQVAVSEEHRLDQDAQARREREESLRCELDAEDEVRRQLRSEIDNITQRRQEIMADTTRVLSFSEQQEVDELARRKSKLWEQYDISLKKSYRKP